MKNLKTESLCNKCLKVVPAVKYEKDGFVYLEKNVLNMEYLLKRLGKMQIDKSSLYQVLR